MKRLVVCLLLLGIAGCGELDLGDPETREEIVASAIDMGMLQQLEEDGEGLVHASNEQTPYTGWAKEMYENGQVKAISHYKDGKRDGPFAMWYRGGQKKTEGHYKDGKGDGVFKTWHESGQRVSERHNKDGMLDGPYIQWYLNGQKRYEGRYKGGKMDGLCASWYTNGKKSAQYQFEEGKLTSQEVWKPNGERCPVSEVVDGSGVIVAYRDDGPKLSRTTYVNGRLMEIVTYDPDGTEISRDSF